MTRKVYRVLVVDDSPTARLALRQALESDEAIQVVGEASNGAEAIRLCAELQPDVVLMDLVMPDVDGVAATHAIRQSHPEVQVIVLTSYDGEEQVHAALQAGAIGYLLKSISVDQLAQAIRAASAGKPTLSPEATQALIHAATRSPAQPHSLTERELEVLALLAEGLTNSQIAERLVISRSTVKSHVSNILSKLDVATRAEAVVLAWQHKLIDRQS